MAELFDMKELEERVILVAVSTSDEDDTEASDRRRPGGIRQFTEFLNGFLRIVIPCIRADQHCAL